MEEENRLRALRRLLADREATQAKVRRLPVDPGRVARAFTEIEKLVAADPAAAREALAGYLDPIVLRVVDDGGEQVYKGDVTLKRNMAALASGHVVDEASCGGRI